MRLWLEVDGTGQQPPLPNGGAALCAFCSFAVSRGFGATHPLIALADRLHDQHKLSLGPLTTFYGEAEDAEDTEKLELAWQEPQPLAASLTRLIQALQADEQARTLARRGGGENLISEAEALVTQLQAPSASNTRVRMVYAL